ncbi:carotenoid isomerooxygenase-like [Pieris brassicae]|uniref:carotenoid isomerooxygenase-like n=1 Tax=Pieris brassicae TaxID=7116 RepID=UPI001E6624DE|nr:carotenoid isomerooxygenase-like [Pieris brassicae]
MSKIEENGTHSQYDSSVFLRTCEKEVTEPLEGSIIGAIPFWIRGSLLRNGPGLLKVGKYEYQHIFDGSALLHRFAIFDGQVTYQCKFLISNTYKKNKIANRIVVTEFATRAVPDPCQTIFDKFSSVFNPANHMTDNAVISIYPFGDEVYALTEVPLLYRIDPVTLETMDRRNLIDSVVITHTAHPHIANNGDVYNVGMHVVKGRIKILIVKFPFKEKGDMFESAQIVGTVTPRWYIHPCYMHSFGMSENYFVLIEQPLALSISKYLKCQINGDAYVSALNWYSEYETHIVTVSRIDGTTKRYRTATIFILHVINCFERDGELLLDMCTYQDAKIIDAMFVDAIKASHSNLDYAKWCSTRPRRFHIPLNSPEMTLVHSEVISDIGVEMPRINYELHNGRPYNYFYGILSDVSREDAGAVVKVNVSTGKVLRWKERYSYPSEPVFIPRPGAVDEDDGVILSAVLWSNDENAVDLLVLDARTFKELGRARFRTPTPAPKCLHGWFLSDNKITT